MKGIATVLILSGICFSVYASSLKKENAKITADRKMIADLEKGLSKDERGCEKPSEGLDKSVLIELQIYCNARNSAKRRLVPLKDHISAYETAVTNYYANCKIVDTDELFVLCEALDDKVVKAAELVNDEKESLRKDLDEMENSAKKAAIINKEKNDWSKKEHDQQINDSLRVKRDLVMTMQKGLIDDSVILEKSRIKFSSALNNSSGEIRDRTEYLLKGVTSLISVNKNLRDTCQSMTRNIDITNSSCTIKYSEKACTEAENKLTQVFDEGNAKLKAYTGEKERLRTLEMELHKLSIAEIAVKMENANRQISFYIGNLQLQNDQLKQRIELSGNDLEVLKGMDGKAFVETYLGYVETMKSLEKESAGFIDFLGLSTARINEFIKNCTQNKSEYSTECRIEGDNIVKDVDSIMKKISQYGAKFSRLNSDLAAFAKKVSGK
ncbi:MAG TPA: hypothetical protein PLW78_02610 [bacterium]|nr:hypothetical protein [bacterium]HRQ69171.1 hypothetical protein [bacterium]